MLDSVASARHSVCAKCWALLMLPKSIWNAPPRVANWAYGLSNVALVIAAILGMAGLFRLEDQARDTAFLGAAVLTFIGTIGELWASAVRDKHSDLEIAAANERAEQARALTVQTSLELERERKERMELQAKVSSRTLPLDQRNRLIAEVRARLPFEIYVELIHDQEALIYGQNIVSALQEAGATLHVSTPSRFPVPTGLQIGGSGALRLAEAFMAAKISFAQGAHSAHPKMIIGLKPPAI